MSHTKVKTSVSVVKDEEHSIIPTLDVQDEHVHSLPGLEGYFRKIVSLGVELHGSSPVNISERTHTRTINIFTLWFTMSLNLLP